MAISSNFYTIDGNTKTFPSTKHAATKQHMAIWLQLLSDSTWVQLNTNDWDLINNAAVLVSAPDTTTYIQLEVRVADQQNEIVSSPSDISIVAAAILDVNTVAGIESEVVTVAGLETEISGIHANLAEILLADDSAAAALASANNAALSETNAATSETNAGTSATNAQLKAWEAEAERLTADSYATEAVDVPVNIVTSDGDGTFTYTPTSPAEYSALHQAVKAGLVIPTPAFPADEGLALVAREAGNDWEKILGLPLETGNKGKSVTNNGVEGDSFWSPVTTNPNVLTADYAIASGTSATVASGFTIADGVTLTIPDGSVLGVV